NRGLQLRLDRGHGSAPFLIAVPDPKLAARARATSNDDRRPSLRCVEPKRSGELRHEGFVSFGHKYGQMIKGDGTSMISAVLRSLSVASVAMFVIAGCGPSETGGSGTAGAGGPAGTGGSVGAAGAGGAGTSGTTGGSATGGSVVGAAGVGAGGTVG